MFKFFLFSFLVYSISFFSQTPYEKCGLEKSYFEDLYRVDAEDVKCLAKNSDKPNTILVSFARWCEPCLWHLPNHMELETKYETDFYTLLVDKENDNMIYKAKEYVWERYPNAKILIIKDYKNRGKGKKYKEFLNDITPSEFENIACMSKFFVLNKKGNVELITSYKDKEEDEDWKDDSPMIQRLVVPLLTKKEN